jgi:23S rRNA (pseudouridine1915-N3)-methyltransferase
MNIHIGCIGKLKSGPFLELEKEYIKRLQWTVIIHECEIKIPHKEKEAELLINAVPLKIPRIALDERGKNLTSPQFATLIQSLQLQGHNGFVLFIGGADGLDPSLRESCTHTLSLGAMTWPHKMVRPMIMEQLYRAQQILMGHPYHRV